MTYKKKIYSTILFIIIYAQPFYIAFKNNGISFSGNENLFKSKRIDELTSFIDLSSILFIESFNLFQNGIFIFFISAVLYKLLLNIIE